MAQESLSQKIYPDESLLKEIAAFFMTYNYPELIDGWSDARWTFYYVNFIESEVSYN